MVGLHALQDRGVSQVGEKAGGVGGATTEK